MSDSKRTGVFGRPGTAVRVGEEWVGWNETVAHPDSPQGGGGPGNFAQPSPLNANEASDLPSPWQPGSTGAEPLDKPPPAPAPAPKPANPPPATAPASLGVVKEVTGNAQVDYKIEAEIIADGSGGVSAGAETRFTKIVSKSPSYDSDGVKITKFNGKFTFKGTIQIQTNYASDASDTDLSCYGRGTTDADVKARDITLGFHESCHRADYSAYLKANALPAPPTMSVGMKVDDYEKNAAAFNAAVTKYWADMKADSVKKTDDVGFTLAKANQTGKCYPHIIP